MVLKAIQRKFKPLDMVEQIADGVKDGEHVRKSIPRCALWQLDPTLLAAAHAARGHRGGCHLRQVALHAGRGAYVRVTTLRAHPPIVPRSLAASASFPLTWVVWNSPTSPMPGLRAMSLPRMPHGAPPSPTSPPS
eukprot:5638635-Prymnesium_polylepis.1